MLTNEEKERLADQIGELFEGLDLDDVAQVLAVQLAMLTTQGADTTEDAVLFLNEIRDEAEAILRTEIDDDEDEDGGEEDEGGEDDDAADPDRSPREH